jgi:hypothetical protein
VSGLCRSATYYAALSHHDTTAQYAALSWLNGQLGGRGHLYLFFLLPMASSFIHSQQPSDKLLSSHWRLPTSLHWFLVIPWEIGLQNWQESLPKWALTPRAFGSHSSRRVAFVTLRARAPSRLGIARLSTTTNCVCSGKFVTLPTSSKNSQPRYLFSWLEKRIGFDETQAFVASSTTWSRQALLVSWTTR